MAFPFKKMIMSLQMIGAIICCGDKTHTGKDEIVKPETNIENQFDSSQGKGVSSSSSTYPQSNEQDGGKRNVVILVVPLWRIIYDMFINKLGPGATYGYLAF